MEDHAPYGGVVPEIAARVHIEALDRLIEQALAEAGVELSDLDAIAATAGPGLIGGVMVARWGWPAVFWFRAPIALVSLIFFRSFAAPAASKGERFDIAGALLLALGLTALRRSSSRCPRCSKCRSRPSPRPRC